MSVLSPVPPTPGTPLKWVLQEHCGLAHGEQVIALSGHPVGPATFSLRSPDGRIFPAQRSTQRTDVIFARLALQPFEVLELEPLDASPTAADPVLCQPGEDGRALIANNHFALEVPLGIDRRRGSGFSTSGPICRFRIGSGPWRGRSFFDSRHAVLYSSGEILEEGPVRLVYRYRVAFEHEGHYQCLLTVDAGQVFARVEEEFKTGSGDQLVWDFSGEDLPRRFLALDSSASYQSQQLSYHFDTRLTRLAAWTQQSQHLDMVDGFALCWHDEVAAFVTLEGGLWRGDRLNHLEAWVRRWLPGDPASRRDVPASAKADSYPGPERVPARGGVSNEEHFNVEGWIGHGRRLFAFVPAALSAIQPASGAGEEPLGHFEDLPDRSRYVRQQSLLRRIHTQHGVLSLQAVLTFPFVWPSEPAKSYAFAFPHPAIERHFKRPTGEAHHVAQELQDYLAARVYGFWEGSGIAYSNPVVSRRIAPEMFRYEWLARQGVWDAAADRLIRAHFAFLALLFASENYYTGDRAMLPAESPDSPEPTLAGMANQNFYTDVINVFGVAAQVFALHPSAATWRERFSRKWHEQLAFHCYPESGLWEESHTYYQHVLLTVLPTLLRRRADGVDNEFANPAMQKLVASALRQITPRDSALEHKRYLLALGDHGRCPQPDLFADLAEAFQDTHPSFAAELAWLAGEMGARLPSGCVSIAPACQNEKVQGLGVMFRARDAQGGESLFALRSGSAWGHHHNDDGSIQFYAFGQCLVGDSALGENQEGGRKFSAAGHSRWAPRDLHPVNHFWRFNRGWVIRAELSGRFPFAESCSPVFTVRGGRSEVEVLARPLLHWRSVVQLDATTYLVVDTSDAPVPQVVRFHVATQDVSVQGPGLEARFAGGGHLQILPLFAPASSPLVVASHTATTTELACEVNAFSAFVLHAGRGDEGFELLPGERQCTLRTSAWEVQVTRQDGHAVELTDLRGSPNTTKFHIF